MDDLTAPLVTNADRLAGAKESFANKDEEQSIRVHTKWMNDQSVDGKHPEPQRAEGAYVKPLVFGGMDGVGTAFALLAGGVGSNLDFYQVVAMCSATIFASAFSMGFGEYVSGRAERDMALREKARERWEVDIFPEGEVAEMIDLYQAKGLSAEDARNVALTLSKYKDFWVEHMMLHELNIVPPDEDDSVYATLLSPLVMFFSFAIFGMSPILAYCSCLRIANLSRETAFAISSCVAVCALFTLGSIKSVMADTNWIKGGLVMGVQGSVAGASAFFIGNHIGT